MNNQTIEKMAVLNSQENFEMENSETDIDQVVGTTKQRKNFGYFIGKEFFFCFSLLTIYQLTRRQDFLHIWMNI